jgi:serine-type D-Ala-D-Ala carboxypeptidase/endopeptidase
MLTAVEAASVADKLHDALRSAGASGGVVACRDAGSDTDIQTWGQVPRSSIFEAGSVTKVVTGLLLALAIQAGEVAGNDRLDRFLPGTGRAGEATLAELATHTSGLPHLPLATLLRALTHLSNPYRGISLDRLLRDTRHVRRRRRGVAAYSNLGVALLGHALAAAATTPYWDLAQSRVLAPLGMTTSGDLPTATLVDSAKAWDLGAFAPAGGLRATVDDLLRLAWLAARPAESPLAAAAVEALTPRVRMGTGQVGWCWLLGPPSAAPYAWHNGATGASWAFVAANSSNAIAACVPATRRPAWDTAVLSVVRLAAAR